MLSAACPECTVVEFLLAVPLFGSSVHRLYHAQLLLERRISNPGLSTRLPSTQLSGADQDTGELVG